MAPHSSPNGGATKHGEFVVHQHAATRMHHDSKRGVVDANCRVHEVGNLSIAGDSVFPTSGSANPTLTLVALSLRLSDHLRTTLG